MYRVIAAEILSALFALWLFAAMGAGAFPLIVAIFVYPVMFLLTAAMLGADDKDLKSMDARAGLVAGRLFVLWLVYDGFYANQPWHDSLFATLVCSTVLAALNFFVALGKGK